MVPLPAVALAAKVVLWPLQMVVGAADDVTEGLAFAVTLTVPVAEHKLELVTVTV
jgi:hypothetical protein